MVGGDIYREIWNGFACGSTPNGPIIKWIAQADPAHQIGLQPTLHAILIAVESGCRGVEEWSAGIFTAKFTAKFGMVLLVAPHLMVL
jgi:hypothetical protein